MTTLEQYNSYGEDLERLLLLKTSPIAVKLLEKEEDIPEGSTRPKRDLGYHLAQRHRNQVGWDTSLTPVL